jgi:NitT/TauT family transport system substrate-binding protein
MVRDLSRLAVNFAMAVILLGTCAGIAVAEPIKIAMLKQPGVAPLFIAQEKGYFAAEGLQAELVYLQSGQAIAVAVASGDIDFGAVGVSGGFYNLAGQGVLKIIAGSYREAPGFPVFAVVASNRAYAAGFTSYKALTGRSIAVTAVGSAGHYTLALLAEKFGVDLKSVHILPTQTITNAVSAVSGGQADGGVQLANITVTMLDNGNCKLIGWAGEDVPWQLATIFTASKTADAKRDTVERFLRAYRKGSLEYHDAFIGPDGKRKDGPNAPAMLALIGKYVNQPVDQVARSISFNDAGGRLDVNDVLHQIAWYRSQGMVKGDFDPASVIDRRFVVPMP